MKLDELLTGLKDWNSADTGLDSQEIDNINKENAQYRKEIMHRLGFKSGNNAILYGGAINLKFEDSSEDTQLPIEEIIALGETLVFNQLGGGFLEKVKRFFLRKTFKKFYAQYEYVRKELETSLKSVEVAANGMETTAKEKAAKVRDLMLNAKAMIVMETSIDDMNVPTTKRDTIRNQMTLAKNNEKIMLREIKQFDSRVKSKEVGITIFGFEIPLTRKYFSTINKMKNEVQDSFEKFNDVVKEYEYYAGEMAEYKNLKSTYAGLSEADVASLDSSGKKEYKKFRKLDKALKNYANMSLDLLQEVNLLVQKKEKFMMTVYDYKEAFAGILNQQISSETARNKWRLMSRDMYVDINNAIKLGNKYKSELANIKLLTEDNHNYISAIAVGALSPVLEQYKRHMESVSNTKDAMDKMVATLVGINNKFVKMEPATNLRMDLFSVSYARTYILTMMQNIYKRQVMFSQGEKYIKQAIKHRGQLGGGGSILPFISTKANYDAGYLIKAKQKQRQNISSSKRIKQYGGFYPASPPTPSYIRHAGDTIYNAQIKTYVLYASITAVAPVNELTTNIPYGALDLNDGSIPGMPANIKVESKYDRYLATKIGAERSTYIPIFEYLTNTLNIYKVKFNDISNLDNLKINSETIPISNITTQPHQFIQIPGTRYYIYNIYHNTPADYKIVQELFNKTNLTPGYIILPLFYKMNDAGPDSNLVQCDEYQLINPITGIPILSYIDRPPTGTGPKDLRLILHGIRSTTDINALRKTGQEQYYYHYNAIGINFNITAKVGLNNTTRPGIAATPFNVNGRVNTIAANIELHYKLMVQLSVYINRIVSGLLFFKNEKISKTLFTGVGDIFSTATTNLATYRNADDTNLILVDTGMSDILTHMFKADTIIEKAATIILTKYIFKNVLVDPSYDTSLIGLKSDPSKKLADTLLDSDSNKASLGIKSRSIDKLDPRTKQSIDTVMRSLPATHQYWKNLDAILKSVNAFFTPEYKEQFETLIGTIVSNSIDMGRTEEKILKIDAFVAPVELPNYSLVVNDLLIKTEKGDVPVSTAGKELTTFLQNNKDFVRQFENDMNVSAKTLLTGEMDELLKMLIAAKSGSHVNVADWFRTGNVQHKDEIRHYLSTPVGATEFINALRMDTVYASHIPLIAGHISNAILPRTSDVFINIYRPYIGKNVHLPGDPKPEKKADDTQTKLLKALLTPATPAAAPK